MGDALNEGWDDEIPVHTVYVEEFYMDIYEVTNSRYSSFLNEYGKNTDTSGNELLDISSPYCLIEKVGSIYRPKAGYEDHPVVGVSWYGAAAYAEFYDKLLPTEAQWEKAARGGSSGKRYPWGNGISHNDANYDGTGGRDAWRETSPAGSFKANGYELHDMVGNVWEWCADWYDNEYYSVSPRRNPAGPVSGRFRVLRGGSWNDTPDFLRVAARGGESPSYADSVVGFRCIVPEKQ
jgi:formylglycine-generating enzyme required for sulfatase activity